VFATPCATGLSGKRNCLSTANLSRATVT